uniref:Major sperm protein n=1 Tax=Ditylenchus dipsaci TaxID=166011 RepID=A0A915CRW9_9BILA
MAKLPQVLILEPSSELIFKGPFTDTCSSDLSLTNPSARPVYFKVKTTAPRYYCVRPNTGVIKPQQSALINIVLQPIMVQAAFGPDEDVAVDSFWKNIDPSEIMDSKLRVSFLSQNAAYTPKKPESEQLSYMPATSLRTQNEHDRTALQREIELRKIYQDEKNRIERENHILNEKLLKLTHVSQNELVHFQPVDGFLFVHMLLIGFIALCVGMVLGKIF